MSEIIVALITGGDIMTLFEEITRIQSIKHNTI
jgi:hypothetical protein